MLTFVKGCCQQGLCKRVFPKRPLQKGPGKKAFAKGSWQEGLCKRVWPRRPLQKGLFQKWNCKSGWTNKTFEKGSMPLQQGPEAVHFQPHHRVWPNSPVRWWKKVVLSAAVVVSVLKGYENNLVKSCLWGHLIWDRIFWVIT